ncbi:MAG TPA: phosphate acyltransferase PlsX [Gemmatimonadaceae bacterium]|nr:phosphate acyltransferase PlsX [Gemmatimonadaceae bacterium]
MDAMGGDFAPKATIAGALLALQDLDGTHTVQLVGQTSVIESELASLASGELAAAASARARIEIVEAPDIIAMSEKPTAGLRRKPKSSMIVGLRLQVDGKSDAFVSAGNTGAQMASSAMLLKLQPGLTRPAIATVFPTARNPVIVLDSGANVDCSTKELLQFAWLGAVYAECIFGRPNPSIGLLSIGEEPEKGNAVVKEAHVLFKKAGFNFHGNLEGRDLPAGASDRGPFDVVICDGFVGNVVLKFYEAVAPMIVRVLSEHPGINEEHVKSALQGFDSTNYGGAPLLGVRGVSIICHGNSPPRAIKNAINVAVRAVETRMNDQIGRRLQAAEPMINAVVQSA